MVRGVPPATSQDESYGYHGRCSGGTPYTTMSYLVFAQSPVSWRVRYVEVECVAKFLAQHLFADMTEG